MPKTGNTTGHRTCVHCLFEVHFKQYGVQLGYGLWVGLWVQSFTCDGGLGQLFGGLG